MARTGSRPYHIDVTGRFQSTDSRYTENVRRARSHRFSYTGRYALLIEIRIAVHLPRNRKIKMMLVSTDLFEAKIIFCSPLYFEFC